ncbi:MAG: hypothetical protein AAFS06_21610, partial [Cyanobacteria bacterium J06631_12]
GWVTMCSASGWLFLRGNGAATGWVTMCSASGWRLSIYRIGEQAQEIDFGGFSPPPRPFEQGGGPPYNPPKGRAVSC